MAPFAYLRDASDCSVGMGWTEARVGEVIMSNCTGKGRTTETVKRSVVARG